MDDVIPPQHDAYHRPLPDGESGDYPFPAGQIQADRTTARSQSQTPNLTVPCWPTGHSTSPTIVEGNSLHCDSFSTFNVCEDMSRIIRGMSLEEVRNIAEGHKKRGNLAEAASEYLRLVDILCQEEGNDTTPTLEALSQLADIYQAQGKLPESAAAYRRVVAGYTKIFGSSAIETLRTIHSLGKVLEESDDYESAESCYRKAIAGLEGLGASGLLDRLNCQAFLGDLLSDMERHDEALETLSPILAGYEDLGLPHRTLSILGSLLEICIYLMDGQRVQTIVHDMQRLLDERIEIDYNKFPEVLLEGVHLASVYSSQWKLSLAESLMARVIPKLELLNDAKYETEKLYGYVECGNLNLRLKHLEQAAYYLGLAKEVLLKLNRYGSFNDPVAAFVDAGLCKIAIYSHRTNQLREGFALNQERLLAMIGVTAESRDTDDEVLSDGSRTVGDDATNAETASYKYGVTFSTTDITGISESEFFTA